MFGSSVRKRPTETAPFAKMNNQSQNMGTKNDNDSPQRPSSSTRIKAATLHTTREIARKERWRIGKEMEKKTCRSKAHDLSDRIRSSISSDFGAASTDGEDSIFAVEDRTYFTHSTDGTSYYTEEEFSSLGESSYEITETDESGVYSRYYIRMQDRNHKSLVLPSSHMEYLAAIGMGPEVNCSGQHQVMSGISEDLGIVASFLWADGTACIGTAAAITHETVTSCKPDPRVVVDSYKVRTEYF
jgi:hypothetical protein